MIHEYDRIRSRQIQAQTPHTRGEEEHIDPWVGIERLDHSMTFPGLGGAVHSHIGDSGHQSSEKIAFDQIQHGTELTENQNSVLSVVVDIGFELISIADTAIGKQLSKENVSSARDNY